MHEVIIYRCEKKAIVYAFNVYSDKQIYIASIKF